MMSRAAYCVRANRGIYAEAFRNGGYAAIGWEEIGDLSGIPKGDDGALGTLYDAAYPDDGKARRGINIGQLRRFLWELEPGDVVVTPMGTPERLLVGIMGSDYYYEVNPNDCPYPHRRKVEWFEEPTLRSSLSVPIQHVLRAALTVFKVRPPDELLKAVGVEAPASESVERVEKEMSTLVLKRLLELDSDEFEILVTELLTVLGFEAEKTGKTGDGGVDVEGMLLIHGFASVNLCVQVKRYKLTSRIDHETVSRFRASVPEKAQGAFVTTSGYTDKAREEAEKKGFKRVGLIDGQQLVGILNEEYDELHERLPTEIREKLGLRRALVVD